MCVCICVCGFKSRGGGKQQEGHSKGGCKKGRDAAGEKNEVPKELHRKKSRQINERVRICAQIESRKM